MLYEEVSKTAMPYPAPSIHPANPISKTIDFNFNWLFSLDDHPEASQPEYNDRSWRSIRLPHDWSIEFPFDPVNGDGATGYLPGGTGWYRKHFTLDLQYEHLAFILFDGVYNNSQIWCNGHFLGQNPYGYSPFWFDLTSHLEPASQEQVLAVRVDHSRYVDSRWYTGSGIYRDVKLAVKSRLHIPIWGVRVMVTHLSPQHASVSLEITLQNSFTNTRTGLLRTIILAPDGQAVGQTEQPFALDAGQKIICSPSLTITQPFLWHPEHPYLYRAIVYVQGNKPDELHEIYEVPFGLRTIAFDPDRGFFINGQNMRIKGVCLHHDGGLVGAAVPVGVWRRRLAALKDAGCNALRLAHNPPSQTFLDLCDEMGFLVQVEFFDEWDNPKDKRLNQHERHSDPASRGYAEHFPVWAESDLKRTILRDRNHPCVFQWSIGNEIEWTYPRYPKASGYFEPEFQDNYFWSLPPFSPEEIKARFDALPPDQPELTTTAQKLVRWTRALDDTRPITANCILPSVSHLTGYADLLDVVGYSYRQVMYDFCHTHYPHKPIMGTENFGQWHEWKHVIERPFISGMFIWTGVDYMGESHNMWPQKSRPLGLLDLAGFKRPSFFMFKSLWQDSPLVYLTTQCIDRSIYRLDPHGQVVEREPGAWKRRLWEWHPVNEHWNYQPGETVVVEVYSNCPEVELFLNNRSLGRQRLEAQEDRIFKWAVPFEAGTLLAVGWHPNGQTVQHYLQTAADPAGIELHCDRMSLQADGYDVAHLTAQLVDIYGVPVRHVERRIVFSVEGPCRVLGVDNGAPDNVQPFQSNCLTTAQGRALLILQSSTQTGTATVSAVSGPLHSQPVILKIQN